MLCCTTYTTPLTYSSYHPPSSFTIQAMVRLEADVNQNRFRITVRTKHATVSLALKNILKAQLGWFNSIEYKSPPSSLVNSTSSTPWLVATLLIGWLWEIVYHVACLRSSIARFRRRHTGGHGEVVIEVEVEVRHIEIEKMSTWRQIYALGQKGRCWTHTIARMKIWQSEWYQGRSNGQNMSCQLHRDSERCIGWTQNIE